MADPVWWGNAWWWRHPDGRWARWNPDTNAWEDAAPQPSAPAPAPGAPGATSSQPPGDGPPETLATTTAAPAGYAAYQARKTNGMAIASLVLSLVWVCGIGSILAIVFGFQAKGQIDRSGGAEEGRGLAIAGIVVGFLGLAFPLLALLFTLAPSAGSG